MNKEAENTTEQAEIKAECSAKQRQIRCNMCGGMFDTSTIELKKKLNDISGVEKTYFTCPDCGFDYTVNVTTAEVRKLQAKLKAERLVYSKNKTAKKLKEINAIEAELKEKMSVLNK